MNSSTHRIQKHQGLLRISLLVMLLAGLIGAQHKANAASPLQASPQPEITVTEQGISLRWQIPEASLSTNAQGQLEVTIPGVERVDSPGEFSLPVVSLLVALPPQGSPTLRIVTQRSRQQASSAPLAVGERTGKYPDEPMPEPEYPTQPASLEEIGTLRGVRLARLVLHPVLPEEGQLQVFSYLEVALEYNAPISPTPAEGDVLIEQVVSSVVNPDQVQSTLLDGSTPGVEPQLALADAPRAAVQVEKPGLYIVTAAALSSAGLPVGSKSLQLVHAGQSVAYEILFTDGDNILDVGEEMRFYAQPRVQRYSTYDTYFISEGTPKIMTTRAAAPGTTAGLTEAETLFEQNEFYPFEDPIYGPIDAGRDGDRWMWARLASLDAATMKGDYYFDLGNVDSARTATMTVYMNGYTSLSIVDDHKVEILVNDSLVGTAIWDGKKATAKVVTIPVNHLKDTGNKLTLRLPLTTVDGVWLDAFKVRYGTDTNVLTGNNAFWGQSSGTLTYTAYLNSAASALLYDVSDPHAPVKLTGATFPTTTSLKFQDITSGTAHAYLATTAPGLLTPRVSPALQPAPAQGASYLVIYHSQFKSGADTLVARRNSQGIAAVSENAQAIFDAYGEGLPTPAAIRAYLQMIYDTWSKRPQYVLLLGDGTWDPKHYKNTTPSFIPPYLQQIDRMGEYAADNRYVTLVTLPGVEADLLPDMLIGRLPVNNADQLTTMINKITAYENNSGVEAWNSRGTLVADYQLPGDGDFDLISDIFFSRMNPAPFYRQKIYYKVNYLTGAATTTAILTAINNGTAVFVFSGHASYHQWGGQIPNEKLFDVRNISSLANGSKLPVLLEFACETSRFDNPWIDSSGYPVMDEAFVRQPNAGAIATFGPTSPGYPGSHEKLGVGFISNLQTGTATLGSAMLAAKLYLTQIDPSNSYLADTYTILGDPAVRIKLDIIDVDYAYLPVISR